MKKIIRLTEGDLHRIIENTVRRALNEVYNPESFDFSDLYVKYLWGPNEEGYYEFQAHFEDGFGMITGAYAKGDIYYDSIVEGNSGYGYQVTIDDSFLDWLDDHISGKLAKEIEWKISRGQIDEPDEFS